MHTTRAERFHPLQGELYVILRDRAKASEDKVAVRLLNALAYAQKPGDVSTMEPRSLFQWHQLLVNDGLKLVNVGPACLTKLKQLLGSSV